MTLPTVVVEAVPAAGVTVVLDGEQHHYLVRIRRVAEGQEIGLVDEQGRIGRARVETIGLDSMTITVLEQSDLPPAEGPHLTMVCSPLKGGATADTVSTCSELGVDGLLLVTMHRSIARVDESKLPRFERVATEAARKVAQTRRMTIDLAPSLAAFLDAVGDGLVFTLDEEAGVSVADVELPPDRDLYVVVGPEGGLDARERELLANHPAQAIRFEGPAYRARTATTIGAVLFLQRLGRL